MTVFDAEDGGNAKVSLVPHTPPRHASRQCTRLTFALCCRVSVVRSWCSTAGGIRCSPRDGRVPGDPPPRCQTQSDRRRSSPSLPRELVGRRRRGESIPWERARHHTIVECADGRRDRLEPGSTNSWGSTETARTRPGETCRARAFKPADRRGVSDFPGELWAPRQEHAGQARLFLPNPDRGLGGRAGVGGRTRRRARLTPCVLV